MLRGDSMSRRWTRSSNTFPTVIVVWRVAFSPDGRRGVSSFFDRNVRVWVMPPGRPPGEEPLVQPSQTKQLTVTPAEFRPTDAISPRTKAILAMLDESIPMDFAGETPLDDVLKYIKNATVKKPTDLGIQIYVDPLGLQEAERTLASPVQISVTGAPLKVTLPLLLGQLLGPHRQG